MESQLNYAEINKMSNLRGDLTGLQETGVEQICTTQIINGDETSPARVH